MAENTNIVQVAVDCYRGVSSQYSTAQTMDSLRQALVEANGGKTYLDPKALRGGKSDALFTLIEEILSQTVLEGLQG